MIAKLNTSKSTALVEPLALE